MGDVAADQAAAASAEAVARRSYGRLLAYLCARTRDIAAAEDALSEAFREALEHWPRDGVPANPEAWLLTVARRRAVDAARRLQVQDAASEQLMVLAQPGHAQDADLAALRPDLIGADGRARAIPDERLQLMFACAHPGIDEGVRAPLMLQVVLGWDAATIASAFRVSPAAMGQRLARGKTRIRQTGIALRVPDGHELPQRLDAVLSAIYAAYADGWSDPLGAQARPRVMALEALWLGRLVAALLPEEPEALGLLALMLYLESRCPARRDAQGRFVPLDAQDIGLWDLGLINEAEACLQAASRFARIGRYQMEAAVQSVHASRREGRPVDWHAIAQLYTALERLTGSPVVTINRALAVSRTEGAIAGLVLLDGLADDARIADYQPFWAARAELLRQCGRLAPAREAYQRAIGLEIDAAVREFLIARCQELNSATLGP